MMTKRTFATSALAASATALGSFAGLAALPQRRADLTITAMSWSEDAGISWSNDPVFVQSDVLFRAVVKNIGRAALTGPLLIEWRVNGSAAASATMTGGLSRNTSRIVVASDTWTPAVAGTYTIQVRADPAGTIREENEANNALSSPLVVESDVAVPVANDDTASTPINTPVTIDVLANDRDPLGRSLIVSSVQSPSDRGGIVAIAADGKRVTYTPPSGFSGNDLFRYEVAVA